VTVTIYRRAQREAEDAALGVAAAEAVRDLGQPAQPRGGAGIVAAAEGFQRLGSGHADAAQHALVGAAVSEPPALRAQQPPLQIASPGADEGEHRVQVVERAEGVLGVRRPGVGEPRPARRVANAAQPQPPQQRRGVDELGDARRPSGDAPIVDLERARRVAEFQVVQREMPPDVRGRGPCPVPVRPALLHPADAFGGAALHFEHVGARMVRTEVSRLELERGERGFLGAAVCAAFFQPEGLHRPHAGVARVGARPGRQDRRDARVQVARVAEQIVVGMRHREREQVARMALEDAGEELARPAVVAGERVGDRRHVHALARVPRQAVEVLEARLRRPEVARIAAAQVQLRFQHVAQGEGRRFVDGAQRLGARLARPREEAAQRALVGLERARRRAADAQAARVGVHAQSAAAVGRARGANSAAQARRRRMRISSARSRAAL